MEQPALKKNKNNEKLEEYRKELREKCIAIFNDKEKLKRVVANVDGRLETFKEYGFSIEKDKIVADVQKAVGAKDAEAFAGSFLKAVEPYLILISDEKVSDLMRKADEDARRKEIFNEDGNFKLSEVLYAGAGKNEAQIHLAPSAELIKEKGLAFFKNEVKIGLKKLAENIRLYPEIKKITATSWIVGKNPALLEDLGFTVIGGISEEEKEKHFKDETRPIAKAFISREDLLEKYAK